MPKCSTFPTLYDECKTVSISLLKKNGYLKPDQWKNGTITWSRGEGENKQITGSISITVNTETESPYLNLDYKSNDKPIKYRVHLVSIPSNIGKGVVWYFICPRTGKRCRKLYLADTYFFHRSAFQGCFYENQTYSHKNRKLHNYFEKAFGVEKIYERLNSKHFKTHYADKPTKRYLQLLKRIDQSQQLTVSDFHTLFR